MYYSSISDWWSSLFGSQGVTVTGWYFISVLIVAAVFGLTIFILAKLLKGANKRLKEKRTIIEDLKAEVNAAQVARSQSTCAKEMAQNELEVVKADLEKERLESSGKDARVKAYEKIFKESLMIANAKSDIAIDKSEILDVMSVDDIRAYAASIGAKATTTMTKAEMIQSCRAREISLKSISNARQANLAKHSSDDAPAVKAEAAKSEASKK